MSLKGTLRRLRRAIEQRVNAFRGGVLVVNFDEARRKFEEGKFSSYEEAEEAEVQKAAREQEKAGAVVILPPKLNTNDWLQQAANYQAQQQETIQRYLNNKETKH